MVCRSGTSGLTRMVNSDRSTACNGATGERPMAASSTRSARLCSSLPKHPIHGALLSVHGMLLRSTRWLCRPVTACFSSMWPMASCRASCTSAAATYFSACHLTSHPTRYSLICSRSRPILELVISSLPAATVIFISITSNRPTSSCNANRLHCHGSR